MADPNSTTPTNLDDFSKAKITILLDEYKRIQQEIYQKIDINFRITNIQTIIGGAFLPLAGAFFQLGLPDPSSGDNNILAHSTDSELVLLTTNLKLRAPIAMLAMLAFGLVFTFLMSSLAHVYGHIYSAATYAHRHIRTRLHDILQDPHARLMEWEPFIHNCRKRKRFQHVFDVERIALIIPPFSYMLVFWKLHTLDIDIAWKYIIAPLMVALSFYYIQSLYRLLTMEKSWIDIISNGEHESHHIRRIVGSHTITIYYKKRSLKTTYIHFCPAGGAWTMPPGIPMSESDVKGYVVFSIELSHASSLECAFNDESGLWDNNGNYNYHVSSSVATVAEGAVKEGAPRFEINYCFDQPIVALCVC